jgi:MinD-like ATPase involved in chromosome partitioning or flagellar assembly
MTRVIGIVSGKGGVGKTTFTINLGIALRKLGKKVVVVDCNVSTPHLAYYLGSENYSVTLNNIFREEVDVRFAPVEAGGVMFIPASEELKDIIDVDIASLRKHIEKLSNGQIFDYIILDSAPGLGREALSVLQACDEIIFLTKPTIPTLTDVTRAAEVAARLGHKNFHVALNMVRNKNYELKALQAKNLFKNKVLGAIPFDEKVMDSTALGIPIMWYKPDTKVSESYMKIASELAGVKCEDPTLLERISNKVKGFIKRR